MLSSVLRSCRTLSPRPQQHLEGSDHETNCVLPDGGPHVFEVTPEVLSTNANKELEVTEAWVVWEPIPGLEDVRGVRRAVQHSFLVFVLEPGELLAHNNETYRCQYLRVERQQLVVPQTTDQRTTTTEEEAFLNFRFCRDPLVVKGLDVPGAADSNFTHTFLGEHRIEQWPKQPITFDKQLTLGVLLDVIMTAHNERKQYDFVKANCIWFVGKIIKLLAAMEYVSDNVREELKKDMRFSLARNLDKGVAAVKEVADEYLPERLVESVNVLKSPTKRLATGLYNWVCG